MSWGGALAWSGVLCLVLALAAAVLLVVARSAMLAGLAAMRQAESGVRAADLKRNPDAALRRAIGHVSQAHDEFRSAGSELAPLAPLLGRLGWVPGIGGQLAASSDAARLGDQTAAGTQALLRGLQPAAQLLAGDPHGSRPSVAPLLSRLAAQKAAFEESCRSLDAAQRTRSSLSADELRALSSRLGTLDRELPRLRTLCRALTLLPGLLGYPSPMQYLVAYQDAAFLRPTGGFIGSVGLLTVRDGKVSQHFLGTGIRDNLTVPPPEPVTLYNREPAWLLRDSNWSPDFPTSAALERFFFKLDLGWQADGLIDLTPRAAADMLAAIGPVYVPEYHRTVAASNVAALADYYVHEARVHGPAPAGSGDTGRKQFLPIVARRLLARVQDLDASRLVKMAGALGTAASQGDILLNFAQPARQDLAQRLGAGGSISGTTSDYLYVVDSNLSYNRINPYVHLRVSYHASVLANRWIRSDLTLQYRNAMVGPAPRDWYGPGAGRLGKPVDYADFVRIYVPAGAQLLGQSGWTQPWSGGPAYRRTMFCGYLIVRDGQMRTVRLRYLTPPNSFSWSGGKRYRLLVQHQPANEVDALSVEVSQDGRSSSWRVVRPQTDWQHTLAIKPAPFAPIPLPRPTEPLVAPGHWIEPHAFLGYSSGQK